MIDENWQDQKRNDDEARRQEVETVLNDYLRGHTSMKGLAILCRECGINITTLTTTDKESYE